MKVSPDTIGRPLRAETLRRAPNYASGGDAHTQFMSESLASAASLLAEPARAAMLLQLLGGRALPAGELARAAHISPQTASEHLARLTRAGFTVVHQQGRFRYYALSSSLIADALESMLVVSDVQCERRVTRDAVPAIGTIRHARSCYAHIAGWLGVAIADALQRKGFLVPGTDRTYVMSDIGEAWFHSVGVSCARSASTTDRTFARQCRDWTERRPHLAGSLGTNLYERFRNAGWVLPSRKARVLVITLEGRVALQRELEIVVR